MEQLIPQTLQFDIAQILISLHGILENQIMKVSSMLKLLEKIQTLQNVELLNKLFLAQLNQHMINNFCPGQIETTLIRAMMELLVELQH